ncbi:MAG: hypothetical protein Q8K30_04765 [Candidatus Gracilibacteria bacterium]|nr:hypothetical protein [Candidatus Gracilibacteria bacterium]MDP3381507.1 hypothetical protein [bacterium]
MKKITKKQAAQVLRWSVFCMAALTMGISIAEAAAYNSLQLIIRNPEIAQFSTLVNSGYLFFR